ncbi:MAG: hypothetical protein AAGB19_04065, partial [Cyanobacteria bacterium P01_F01_bin.3]
LMNVSIPIMVEAWEAKEYHRVRKVFYSIASVALLTTLPIVLLLSLFSRQIMGFYGEAFVEGWPLLVLLLAAAPLHAVSKVASGVLYGMNLAWSVLAANIAWSATLLYVTFILLDDLGILALAAAFLSAYAVLSIVTSLSVFFISNSLRVDP